jgi:hypothetical protein
MANHKRTSSNRNATTRGHLSEERVFLPGESAAGFDRIRLKYLSEYPGTAQIDLDLIERLAEREWHRRRYDANLDNVLEEIMLEKPNPRNWDAEDHKLIGLLDRYQRSADRSCRAAWTDIERLRNGRMTEIWNTERAKRQIFENLRDGITSKPLTSAPAIPQDTDLKLKHGPQ